MPNSKQNSQKNHVQQGKQKFLNWEQANCEVSVGYAAQVLGVTERSVLNFIKAKQIKAVKVGKRWYLNELSLVNFAAQAKSLVVSETEHMPVSEIKNLHSETKNAVSENKKSLSEKSLAPEKGYSGRSGIESLNCYRLAVDAFAGEGWQTLHSQQKPVHFGGIDSGVVLGRIANLQLQILEALGAGYHCFEHLKESCYGKARAAAGSLVAVISSNSSLSNVLQAERQAICEKLLPALVALHKSSGKRKGLEKPRRA